MTTTRNFEVRVTGCKNCPHFADEFGACFKQRTIGYGTKKERKLVSENYDKLTDSCPMWEQTKESETK